MTTKTRLFNTVQFSISMQAVGHLSTEYPVETYDLRQPDPVIPIGSVWFPYYRLTNEFINSHLFDAIAFVKFFKKYRDALQEYHQLVSGTVRSLLKQGVEKSQGDKLTKAYSAFYHVDPNIVEQLIERFLYWMGHYTQGVYPSPKTYAVKILTQLTNTPELNASMQATALQEDDPLMGAQATQSPLIPVGFVTTDCNTLREYQHCSNGTNILPRFVMIYFCYVRTCFM